MNIMAEEIAMAEVMKLLEAEPTPAALPAANIPELREQLAILVSTGKCKEAIGVNLTHEQVKRLDEKDVMKHYKRYDSYVGAKTTETLHHDIVESDSLRQCHNPNKAAEFYFRSLSYACGLCNILHGKIFHIFHTPHFSTMDKCCIPCGLSFTNTLPLFK